MQLLWSVRLLGDSSQAPLLLQMRLSRNTKSYQSVRMLPEEIHHSSACYEQFPGFKCRGQVESDLARGRPHTPNLRSTSSKAGWLWPAWVHTPTHSPAQIHSLCLLITSWLPRPTDSFPFTGFCGLCSSSPDRQPPVDGDCWRPLSSKQLLRHAMPCCYHHHHPPTPPPVPPETSHSPLPRHH